MMRPKAVKLGEQIYAGSIILTVVLAVVGWNEAVAASGVVTAAVVNAVVIGLTVLLLYLTTRRASRAALWLLVMLTAINIAGYLFQVAGGVVATGLFGVLTTAQTVLSVVAIVLLFRPSARAWFAAMAMEELA